MPKIRLAIAVPAILLLTAIAIVASKRNVASDWSDRPEAAGRVPTNQTAVAESKDQAHTEHLARDVTAKQESAEDPDDKLKPLSKEKEIPLLQEKYPRILMDKGFTPHEIDVITRFQIEEIKAVKKDELSAIDKSVKALGLSREKKDLLDQAFYDLYFVELVEFSISDVQRCLSKRLSRISDCTQSVLDDFLRDMALELETGVFKLSVNIIEMSSAARKKAIETCHETPERAEYQFRLVFVECETR